MNEIRDKDRGFIAAKVPLVLDPPSARFIAGDALKETRRLDQATIDLCFTSVPYFGFPEVDYDCPRDLGKIKDLDVWVDEMVKVFAAVKPTLKPKGVCVIEIADSSDSKGGRNLAPENLTIALKADGWTVRQEIIIYSTNSRNNKGKKYTNKPVNTHHRLIVLSLARDHYYERHEDWDDSMWGIVIDNYTRTGTKGTMKHPAPMQRGIAEKVVQAFSPVGGTVLRSVLRNRSSVHRGD